MASVGGAYPPIETDKSADMTKVDQERPDFLLLGTQV